MIVALVATVGVALVAIALWWRERGRGASSAEAWRERAGQEAGRADSAVEVADVVTAEAAATQARLEEEIADAAQARIDRGDPGARERVQDRWRAAAGGLAAPGGPAGGAASVPGGAAAEPGPDPARGPEVRGRR